MKKVWVVCVVLSGLILQNVEGMVCLDHSKNKTELMYLIDNDLVHKAKSLLGRVENVEIIKLIMAGKLKRGWSDKDIENWISKFEHEVNVLDTNGNSPLMRAVRVGNPAMIRLLMDNGADLDIRNDDGYSAVTFALMDQRFGIADILLEKAKDVNAKDLEYTTIIDAAGSDYKNIVKRFLDNKFDINERGINGETAVMRSVAKNRLKMTQFLINNGADIRLTDSYGTTALMIASREGYYDIANLLIQYSNSRILRLISLGQRGYQLNDRDLKYWLDCANINARDVYEKSSALMNALEYHHFDIVNLLLDQQIIIDVNLANVYGNTPLILAVRDNNMEIIEKLIEKGAKVDQKNRNEVTALMVAVNNNYTDKAKFLLDHGADINTRDSDGESALIMAINRGNLPMIRWLVKEGADVNVVNRRGKGALFLAAYRDEDMVRFLINSGAEVDIADEHEETALMVATQKGKLEIARLLIDNGADVNKKNLLGGSALEFAASRGDLELVKLLLNNGAYVDTQNKYGSTPLSMAAKYGYTDIVKLLLKWHVDVNKTVNSGVSALMMAVQSGKDDIVKLLLDKNADVNQWSISGFTALMMAAQENQISIARQLINHPLIKINAQSRVGCSALMLAAQKGHTAILDMLLDSNANANLLGKDGETALMLASQNGHEDIVRLLVGPSKKQILGLIWKRGHKVNDKSLKNWMKSRVNLNIKDRVFKKSALMVAVEKGYLGIVKLLIEAGANINDVDSQGRTPLMIAEKGHNSSVINFLKTR